MSFVDGNALSGALSLAMGAEMSNAAVVCATCGLDHPMATSHVYVRCPGMVMRCPRCSGVEVVLVEIDHRLQLTLSGLTSIRLAPADR